ncbi:hypothetical protein NHX12_025997 [Muraenolepis orangiensis]|uniref:TTF-type domain-containing protein n=1 Tax=Muraenolepis orangiensis TaxID=630683 RepID=A0A9Q0IRH5_9TELE|nr:hypothetical protein NHX12_025997 [Muraenolepis orangiensis]
MEFNIAEISIAAIGHFLTEEADVSSEESDPQDTRTEETDSSSEESDPQDTRTEETDSSSEESDPQDTRTEETDGSSEESDPQDTRTEETDSSSEESDPQDTRTEETDGSSEESEPQDTRTEETDGSSEESDPQDTRTEETDSSSEESDPQDTRTEETDGSSEESEPQDTRTEEPESSGEAAPQPDTLSDNSTSAQPIDLGLWPDIITDSFRTEMVRRGPFEVRGSYVFPKNGDGRAFHNNLSSRKMSNGETVKRTWLLYSERCDVVFCFSCKLLIKQTMKLRKGGVDDWKNIRAILHSHESNSSVVRPNLPRCLRGFSGLLWGERFDEVPGEKKPVQPMGWGAARGDVELRSAMMTYGTSAVEESTR